MNTLLATSPDGTLIAYDSFGSGPAILLLHGGGGSRLEWHQVGYVQRLQEHFTVVALDLRGHGESDLPIDPEAYTIEKLEQDILAVMEYEASIPGSLLQVQVVEGLDHDQLFDGIERVFPIILAFTHGSQNHSDLRSKM